MTAQDCANCPMRAKCWDTSRKPSDQALAINLLVCRIKLGIKVNQSTRLLLRLLRPKVLKIAKWMQDSVGGDLENLVAETESEVIERILVDYKLEARAWPLHYLFGRPAGVVRGWAMKYVRRKRHEARIFVHTDAHEFDDLESQVTHANATYTRGLILSSPIEHQIPDYSVDTPPHEHAVARNAMQDGFTLSLSEFRVMQFCSTNASLEHRSSPVKGLHGFLAKHAEAKRSTISKNYRMASYKLIESSGRTDEVLAKRGVATPNVDKSGRTKRIYGFKHRLTADELYGLLRDARNAEPGMTVVDICWAYGITDRTFYKIRDRFDEYTLDQIRAIENGLQ